MWRLIAGLLFFGVLLNAACSSKGVSNEEYEVYSFLIDSRHMKNTLLYPYVVIGDRTVVPKRAKKEIREKWSLLTHAAWADFDDKNQESWPLVDRFFTGTRCYLVPLEELEAQRCTTALRERFPYSGATLVFSRVGFASRGRFAAVYLHDSAWGGLHVLERFYFLAKEDTGWRILGDFRGEWYDPKLPELKKER